MEIHKNMSIRNTERIAKTLGWKVYFNSSGEIVFQPPLGRKYRCSAPPKRKDTPQILVSALRKYQQEV